MQRYFSDVIYSFRKTTINESHKYFIFVAKFRTCISKIILVNVNLEVLTLPYN